MKTSSELVVCNVTASKLREYSADYPIINAGNRIEKMELLFGDNIIGKNCGENGLNYMAYNIERILGNGDVRHAVITVGPRGTGKRIKEVYAIIDAAFSDAAEERESIFWQRVFTAIAATRCKEELFELLDTIF